jgi:hypothetical protein
MKRIVASVGLVAVGAAGLQAGVLPALTTESGKPWNVSATLRGFYDDNVNTVANSDGSISHRGSTGFEVSPALQFSFPMEQTTLNFGYVYSLKYYQYQPIGNTDHYDQTHEFNAALTHAFSERYTFNVKDSFVIGQEPDFLRAGNTYTTFQRISGSNLRNYGAIGFSDQITPEFGIELGYANTYYSYADNANLDDNGNFRASNSGLLDQLDHEVHLDGRYQIHPQTIGVVGLQFRETDYIGDQIIGEYKDINNQQVTVMSNERNARSYYGYVGLDHNFRPDLTGSIRAGMRYTDYYNDPTSQNDISPYALASLRYTYRPGCSLEGGFSYDYSSTSQFSVNANNGNLTLNGQSASVYATLRHQIRPKLVGSIIAQFQNTTYYGGTLNNNNDKFYLIGLNLQYSFTPNFSAEIGYDYDDYESQIGNSLGYDRNRIYVGVTGSY